jgi:hypothetical protein
VFADWLDGNDKTRRYNIIHELCHLYTCLPGNFFNRLLDNLYAEDERKTAYLMAKDEYRRLSEQATQDMAWALVNRESDSEKLEPGFKVDKSRAARSLSKAYAMAQKRSSK